MSRSSSATSTRALPSPHSSSAITCRSPLRAARAGRSRTGAGCPRSPGGVPDRQLDPERGPLPGLAGDRDRRLVGVDDRLDDRQARARCPGCGAAPPRPARYMRSNRCPRSSSWIPIPVSVTSSAIAPRGALDHDVHPAAAGRELDRVRDQVVDHLGEAMGVAVDHLRRRPPRATARPRPPRPPGARPRPRSPRARSGRPARARSRTCPR